MLVYHFLYVITSYSIHYTKLYDYDNYYLAHPYLNLIKKGEVTEKELNDKVRRILRLVFRTNMAKERHFGSFGTEEHALAGRTIAQQGIVLLQNKKNVLPVDASKVKRVLVVGENAVKRMTVGGGSSSLKAKYEVSPLEGIKARLGDGAEVIYSPGYASPAVKEQDVLGAEEPDKMEIV